jgi:ABC-type ATPase with predicted acetyltransferase domain
MAVWKCNSCGATKESRCKPKKCSQCGAEGSMVKEEAKEDTPKKGAKRKKS